MTNIIKELMRVDFRKMLQQDIGVVCAYRKQAIVIREKLRYIDLGGIRTGTVEDFQGQEALCVIVSTVTSHRHNGKKIGLLGDKKLFNVSLTRAQALCIVVGNPASLYTDPLWRYI